MEEEQVLERIRYFKEKGIMRRFGARVRHREAGYRENIMAVWKVREEEVERVGAVMAASSHVSHCYTRPELPDFPYNLYCMVHGREEEDGVRVIEELARETGIKDYKLLKTVREYKKTSPLYFV